MFFLGLKTLGFFIGKLLKERDKYSVFVRAWYSANEFAVFKSPGVIVYTTAPKTTVLLGRQVSIYIFNILKTTVV